MNRNWLVPLSGVAFVVVLILGFAVGGETPDVTDDSAQEIVDFYADNEGSQMAAVLLTALAGILLLVFATHLRNVLRAAEPPGTGHLSTLVLAGAIMVVVGIAIDGSVLAALAESSDDIDPVAAQALQAFWNSNFLPYVIGLVLLLGAGGLSILRHGALAAWLGWVALGLVVLMLVGGIAEIDALFAIAGLGAALWVIVLSVMLTVRARRAQPRT